MVITPDPVRTLEEVLPFYSKMKVGILLSSGENAHFTLKRYFINAGGRPLDSGKGFFIGFGKDEEGGFDKTPFESTQRSDGVTFTISNCQCLLDQNGTAYSVEMDCTILFRADRSNHGEGWYTYMAPAEFKLHLDIWKRIGLLELKEINLTHAFKDLKATISIEFLPE